MPTPVTPDHINQFINIGMMSIEEVSERDDLAELTELTIGQASAVVSTEAGSQS
jgi:hypothetical protein